MYKIKTYDLLEIYSKATKLKLDNKFIDILEIELIRRGLSEFIMYQNVD